MRENLRKAVRQRRGRQIRDGKAVSPVVATLILILVAVAAAAALYLWLVAWQGNVTGGIGSPSAQSTLTIGGSTSVYPFTQVAVQQFQQNNSNIVISNNQGGTGAGMLAVCHGAVDIGASSSLQTVAGLQTNDGCLSTATITTVAYDAVDILVASANTHGLLSMSSDTLALVYARASPTPTLVPTTINGVSIGSITGYPAGALTWAAIPATVNGAVLSVGTQVVESAGAGAGGAACAAPYANDICAATFGTTATPCGLAICASGAATIKTVDRSDASGTTQTFEARLLGATSSVAFASTFAGLGFGGCGSNNLIADCGYAATTHGNGNPGVISAVAGSADSIGYASDGLARAGGSGVAIVAFNNVNQVLCATGSSCSAGAVVPTLGATGTISAGIKTSGTVPNYAGWRPFEYVTLNTPTGEAERFIQYVLSPANNQNFATESFEVSVYSI
jgi:flagellin-like protein